MEQKMKPGVPQLGRPSWIAGGISGSTLKMIAVITMLIDHTAAGVLARYLSMKGIGSLDMNDMEAVNQWFAQNGQLYAVYAAMRMIGRIAFPIYCFLLIQGFEHTKNRMQYAARLFIFAAVSEVPFDLLFNGKPLEFGYQNVFFTLFLGLMAVSGIHWLQNRQGLHASYRTLGLIAVIAGCALMAQNMRTDYAATGVLCIVTLYLFRKNKKYQILAGCVVFIWELTAPLAFIPIALYNGKRGWNAKYVFYLFYPVHILVLYLLCMMLGVASYSII